MRSWLTLTCIVVLLFGALETAKRGASADQGTDPGVETEEIFGFSAGSDTAEKGARSIGYESVVRFGKRGGSYTAVNSKLEFGYGLTDDLSVSLAGLADYHRVQGVPGFEAIRTHAFNGVGGEIRWRLVKRSDRGVGITLQIEPAWMTHDEGSGMRGTFYGSENKVIFDTEVVKDRWFAALNILYDLERGRERGSPFWENGSQVGLAASASVQLLPDIFLAGEVRYLRAYSGLALKNFAGHALFIGPAIFAKVGKNAFVSIVWNTQVWGREVGNPLSLELANFERNEVRIKAGMDF